MLPMTSHLFSSGSYRSMVFPISEPIQPPAEEQEKHDLKFVQKKVSPLVGHLTTYLGKYFWSII